MELKMNYQYTYFIHPFVVKEEKYEKYITKMLKDRNIQLKQFEKEKDIDIYKYFLPKVREFLFPSFKFNKQKYREFEKGKTRINLKELLKNECNIFSYNVKSRIQAKIDEKKGIFFDIAQMDIICFKTGICFLVIKTELLDKNNFEDILNFNYKFRDINSKEHNLTNYDNIRIQTDTFQDVKTFQEFIEEITETNSEQNNLEFDYERFYTYSYTCIDQENWNSEEKFESIKEQFIKYANILPVDNGRIYNYNELDVLSDWKYAKLAITKQASMLLCSTKDINSYTILPVEYEKQYLYTYILNLYKRIYLKKLQCDLNDIRKIKKTIKSFIEFTKKVWIKEITEEQTGTLLNQKIQKAFEIDSIYKEVKSKYEIIYKGLNIDKNTRETNIIILILIGVIVFNIINFIILIKK